MKNLSEKTLLANLKIQQWSARKFDRKISREIEQEHNTRNAGRFNKILIAEDELKEIQRIAGACRIFLYNNTLPWGDNGDRLLPATNYLEFVAEFRGYKTKFDQAVGDFIRQYPDLIAEAQKRLNGMFDETDYPPVHQIRNKFGMGVTFMPISDVSDFRLQLADADVDGLKAEMESEISSRIADTTRCIWDRIQEAVSHMVEKLSDQDAIFRDSLVSNIAELINVLPRLNFTGDSDIAAVIDNMKSLVVSPVALRNDRVLRIQKAEEARAIIERIQEFVL